MSKLPPPVTKEALKEIKKVSKKYCKGSVIDYYKKVLTKRTK